MNALKKINERVKQLQKKHPNAKRKTLQKQAGREWKSGKLKARKKAAPKRVKSVRRKTVAKKRAAVRKRPIKRAARRVRTRTITKTVYKVRRVKIKSKPRRRVGSRTMGGKSLMPIVAIAALGVGAYLLLSKPATPPSYIQTGNYQRDNAASNILAYATAAGLAASAIAKLIDSLNNSSDSTVISAGQNPQQSLEWLTGGD